jgi:hypothetical protein
MAFKRAKVVSLALVVGALANQHVVRADGLDKPVAIGADAGSQPMPIAIGADVGAGSGVDLPVDVSTTPDQYGDGYGDQYDGYDTDQYGDPYGDQYYGDPFGDLFGVIGGSGRGYDLDLDTLFGELLGGLQGLLDQNAFNGSQIGAIDGLGGLDLSGILDSIDIQGLLDQLNAELGNLNLTETFQDVSQQIQPVIDAAMTCASNATELAQPASACMQSISGSWDVGSWDVTEVGGMTNLNDLDDDGEGGRGLRKLLHMGREGMFGGPEAFDGPAMIDPSALCTPECTAFLNQVTTTCPDLASLVLNGTNVDICSGVEPGPAAGQDVVLDPLPDKPVADVTVPVSLPEAPANNDTLPVLIPIDQQTQQAPQTGTSFVAGEPSSASVISAAVSLTVCVLLALV